MDKPKQCVPWYEKWFDEHYLHVYGHRNEEDARIQADLIARLFPPESFPEMLDLCCGEGRHARIFYDKGYSVTGVDLSLKMIETARKNSDEGICFNASDMRDIEWKDRFDIVVNLFTSFGYFDKEEEDRSALEAVCASLKKGGSFWIDFMNREYVLEHMEPVSKKEIRGKVVEEKRGLSHDEKRIIKDIVLSEDGHIHRYNESVRMYSREELRSLVENSGLTITHEFGDYTGELFSDKSPRLILAARKQAE